MHTKLVIGPTDHDARLIIDGVNVAPAVRGITVRAEAGSFTTAVLELAMVGAEVDGIQHLYLAPAQVGLLARFGWQPPTGAQIEPDGSVRLERLADPKGPRGDGTTVKTK